MRLSDLLARISFYVKSSPNEQIEKIIVSNIKNDHRDIKEGDIFICIKGFMVDGHEFAKEAEEKGAVAILAERSVNVSIPTIILSSTKEALAKIATFFYNFPSEQLQLFGITGTNGKTTISYLLNHIFTLINHKTGIIGTIETKIDTKTFSNTQTTPDALTLQKTLSKMVEAKVQSVFMEVSSHALALGRVHGCDFDVAIFTNLTQDHLDFHETMDRYLHAKSLLFSQLGNTFDEVKRKYVIINKDDAFRSILQKSTAQYVLTYSCFHTADIMAKNINLLPNKTQFTMVTPIGQVTITSPLIGMFNISNMLAAAAAAIIKGVPLSIIKQSYEQMDSIPGRFEVVSAQEDYTVIIDYAHTPDSLLNVLKTIHSFARGKIYVVIGCGGDRDRSKRPLMAKVSVTYANHAFFTSDNPRTEEPQAIIDDMVNGLEQTNYAIEIDRQEAIHLAIQQAEKNDIILIAGKGHETYQEINGIKYDFDDRIIAEQAIKKKEN